MGFDSDQFQQWEKNFQKYFSIVFLRILSYVFFFCHESEKLFDNFD